MRDLNISVYSETTAITKSVTRGFQNGANKSICGGFCKAGSSVVLFDNRSTKWKTEIKKQKQQLYQTQPKVKPCDAVTIYLSIRLGKRRALIHLLFAQQPSQQWYRDTIIWKNIECCYVKIIFAHQRLKTDI